MEPLESGQIQPLGLSHAIGPPGWRPYFQRGIPSILKRLKHPKPDHQSLWWTFPLAPPSPPPAPPWPKDPLPADSRDPATSRGGPGGNAPNFCTERCCWAFCAPLGPPGPPWAPLDPPGPPGPSCARWASLGPPAPLGRPGPPCTPALLSPPQLYWLHPLNPLLGPLAPLCCPALGPFGPAWAPLNPSMPSWAPLRLTRPGPPWAPLNLPGPFGRRDQCLPVLAAKAEVGIEGASPKP